MKFDADLWTGPKPVRIWDATGIEWLNVVWGDSETGEIHIQKRDYENFILVNPFTNQVLLDKKKVPPPLALIHDPDFFPPPASGWKYMGCICRPYRKFRSCPACTVAREREMKDRLKRKFEIRGW